MIVLKNLRIIKMTLFKSCLLANKLYLFNPNYSLSNTYKKYYLSYCSCICWHARTVNYLIKKGLIIYEHTCTERKP